MPRSRNHTRKSYKSHPKGVLKVAQDGYGFVSSAEGEFFIPEHKMKNAFDGDVVEIEPLNKRSGGARPLARVVCIDEHAHEVIVGRYSIAEPFGVVVPLDTGIKHDVFTMRADSPDVPDGALVKVRIAQYPTRSSAATGYIEEVLQADTISMPIEMIIAHHKLETSFSDSALEEARKAQVDSQAALNEGYIDLSSRYMVTIDPADAKDFDDAISVDRSSKHGAIWRLGVHIADVSYYVPWDSSIDLDARRRATSVYLADRVIPMLPFELSDDICSLKPQEIRRSLSVDMYIDQYGEIKEYEIYPALIKSKKRLAYTQVLAVMNHCALDEGISSPKSVLSNQFDSTHCSLGGLLSDERLVSFIEDLSAVSYLLEQAAVKRGSLDFIDKDPRAILDDAGECKGVSLREKTPATKAVEFAMIAANSCVAHYLCTHEHPAIYRSHEHPLADSLSRVADICSEFIWFNKVDKEAFICGNSHELRKVLDLVKGRLEEELVSTLLVRSMKRALYSSQNDGHFALGCEFYTHFTSPIRRYPDLVVHRMLKDALGVSHDQKTLKKQVEQLNWIAEHSSEMELHADAAARESQETKIIEYLQAFVGQRFRGVISGVTTYCLYVKLEYMVEGMLDVSELGKEYFILNPQTHTLTGSDSGEVYRLGQSIDVILKEANPQTRLIMFKRVRP